MEEIGGGIVYPTLEQICEINRRMVSEFGGLFVPPNNLLNQNALEYILRIIRTGVFGHTPYPTLKEKASAATYHIITRHVFRDGNKRTAIHTAWEFLRSNDISLFLDQSVIDLSIGVAMGQTAQQEVLTWLHSHQEV
jgi:death-on-curing protein